MAPSTADSWHQVVEEKISEFQSRQCNVPPNIDREASFRSEFESLCKNRLEFNYTKLLARLSYNHISAFARAVDAVFKHGRPHTLAALVFGGCFVAIHNGYDARIPLADLIELLGGLNKAVPSLAIDVPRFPSVVEVQAPLQEVFSTYIDMLLVIIDSFNTDSGVPGPRRIPVNDITQRIEEAAAAFQSHKLLFAQNLEQAQRNENNRVSGVSGSSRSYVSARSDDSQKSYNSQAHFQTQKLLGRGSYGDVYAVLEPSLNRVMARKVFYLDDRNASDPTELEGQVTKECEIMEQLTHDHIVKVMFPLKEEISFSIFMLPVADEDLRSYLESCVKSKYPTGSRDIILSWFGCLADALAFAHRKGIVHRDIKPSNILIKGSQVYLADFGLAKDFARHNASATNADIVRGTPIYRAPEVRVDNPRGPPADVFSLGCVFSEMLTVCCNKSLDSYQSYRKATDDEFQLAFRANLRKVNDWVYDLGRSQEDEVYHFLISLLRSMLKKKHEERPTMEKVFSQMRKRDHPDELFCSTHSF